METSSANDTIYVVETYFQGVRYSVQSDIRCDHHLTACAGDVWCVNCHAFALEPESSTGKE